MEERNSDPPAKPTPPPMRKRFAIVTLFTILALAVLCYRLLVIGHLEQTALMFIGLPTVLAILLAWLPGAQSNVGKIVKGITYFLLLLGILAIEGFICILMAAPFFYFIGVVVGIVWDAAAARKKWQKNLRSVVLPSLVFMSFEGVSDTLSFSRDEQVTASISTTLDQNTALHRLAQGPDFKLENLPLFLKLGFPEPQYIKGDGIQPGDTWKIHFAGGEGSPGTLMAEVVHNKNGHIIVNRVTDTSHIAHWLDWESAEWHLKPTAGGTHITLTMHYQRLLDPAWYFKPFQRYGVKLAGEYFLESTFLP